jgi:hypothetical protein
MMELRLPSADITPTIAHARLAAVPFPVSCGHHSAFKVIFKEEQYLLTIGG